MTRYLASTSHALRTAPGIGPAIAQTIDLAGNRIVVDQMTQPGGHQTA